MVVFLRCECVCARAQVYRGPVLLPLGTWPLTVTGLSTIDTAVATPQSSPLLVTYHVADPLGRVAIVTRKVNSGHCCREVWAMQRSQDAWAHAELTTQPASSLLLSTAATMLLRVEAVSCNLGMRA